METFKNESLLEPLEFYSTQLKDAFHNNAVEFFDELTKKTNTNVEENQVECRAYYKEMEIIKGLKKKKGLRIFLAVMSIIGAVAGIVGAIVLILMAVNQGTISMGAGIGGAVGCFAATGLLIFAAVMCFMKAAKLQAEIDEHQKKADEHKKKAYEIMAKLNDSYDWNMAAGLFTKTTPLIQLDPTFNPQKYDYLRSKYGYEEYDKGDISTVYVQSGSILGNPFVFEKNYVQTMRDHRYEGTLVITYSVTVSDGKGGYRRETRTQTLHAYYTAPEPAYYLDTWLIYGNEAAPKLKFSRRPTNINSMNEKQIENYVKSFDKKLDKKVEKSLGSDGNFTRLANEEFEALFNALDRDHETEFRVLFTPLGQRNMIALLKAKDVGFGDDFIFKKDHMLNYVKSSHMQSSDVLDKNPDDFVHFDHKVAKELFVDYCDRYLKDVYFDLAPIISIPVYQQHKDINYIYNRKDEGNVTQAEAEAAANSHNVGLFKHPATRSLGVILKSRFQRKEGDMDITNVTAYSFEGIDRVAYVPVMGGDGLMHNVPVHWIEYLPISKTTPFVVTDTNQDKSGYRELYQSGKFNDSINKFGNSSAILYKKRMMSFVPKNK